MPPLVCPRCRRPRDAAPGARCEVEGTFLVTGEALARSDGDPLLGACLADRFGLLGARAFGGEATVFDAWDVLENSLCVVKAKRGGEEARFAHEAHILRALPSGIGPRLRATGASDIASPESARAQYLATDVARGAVLSVLHPAPEALPSIALAVASAFARVHEAGFVHGDPKPEHLFVSDGSVTLVDFGCAAHPEHPALEPFCASPGYLAPEIDGTPPTPASDVYALGCVLFRLASGRLPFVRPTLEALRSAHRSEPPPALPEAVPAGFRDGVAAALAKDQAVRPADGAALLALLTGSS
ncbi:MAG: phosphotransferase [Polyangiaceae bacterium]|nr:phosphotransferase [Polyangiaceae bacterium]